MPGTESLLPGFVPRELAEEGLADHARVILGVDALDLAGSEPRYSRDYWDLPDEEMFLWEEHVETAKGLSTRFIEEVSRGKGESLLYALFFINEGDYRKQVRDFGNVRYR